MAVRWVRVNVDPKGSAWEEEFRRRENSLHRHLPISTSLYQPCHLVQPFIPWKRSPLGSEWPGNESLEGSCRCSESATLEFHVVGIGKCTTHFILVTWAGYFTFLNVSIFTFKVRVIIIPNWWRVVRVKYRVNDMKWSVLNCFWLARITSSYAALVSASSVW